MFRIIFPNTWYVDHHGTPCKILRSTHNKVHYIRKGRTCIASMFRFNHDFEPVNKADADRIAEELETAEHIKKLRDMRSKSRGNHSSHRRLLRIRVTFRLRHPAFYQGFCLLCVTFVNMSRQALNFRDHRLIAQ